jgi:hypothetical protein
MISSEDIINSYNNHKDVDAVLLELGVSRRRIAAVLEKNGITRVDTVVKETRDKSLTKAEIVAKIADITKDTTMLDLERLSLSSLKSLLGKLE